MRAIRDLSDRVVFAREQRKGKLYGRKKVESTRARTKFSKGDADALDPPVPLRYPSGPRSSRAGSISSRTRYQHRVTYRPGTNGGRIVVDLWPLILCPDSGIVRPAAAISHPFEKPRAESLHSFILRNMDRDEGLPHNAHCHRA